MLGGPIMAPTICGSTKGLPFEYLSPPSPLLPKGESWHGRQLYLPVGNEGGWLVRVME